MKYLITTLIFHAALLPLTSFAEEKNLASYDRAADPHGFTVFMKEGGWCWYQDPRAIIQGGHLFIGAVQGNGSGAALVGVYDLAKSRPLGIAVMRDNFMRDDHNSDHAFFPKFEPCVIRARRSISRCLVDTCQPCCARAFDRFSATATDLCCPPVQPKPIEK